MVVDDQDIILEFMLALLADAGYDVDTALNGKLALERIGQVRPQLIISDVEMPELNGWQFVQAVRKLPDCRTLPVILTSAGGRLPFALTDLDAWTVFLAKPFGIEEMLALVQRLLSSPLRA
jgi:two-component system sensor histidine kinase/response regulator